MCRDIARKTRHWTADGAGHSMKDGSICLFTALNHRGLCFHICISLAYEALGVVQLDYK